MAIIKLSAIERRRLSVFVTCLVFAAFAWLFTALSNTYKFTVKQIISYKNLPQKRAFYPLQGDTVSAIVQGTGWQMLFSKVDYNNKPINVDIHTLETKNFIVISQQLKQINAKKDLSHEIITVNPDTLFFDFSNRIIKRVPVEVVSDIQYQKQYSQSNDMAIKPGYVTISGPAEVLARIKTWKTDSVKLKNVNDDFSGRVALQKPKEGNLAIIPRGVNVTIPVDEYTEKTLEIPVKVINNQRYYDVRVFPQKVKVTFTTSLTDYPEMNEDDFEAVADLDLWRHNGYSTLPVKVTRLPTYSKVTKIEPQVIDFIIKR
ncbi:YbbR-like domain-containing protein [Mucilaginibacter conchicola]|uniref:YbbR-like domain-containing protein n=1 Tax=Mucilaginibacter conchicola TaxID=2303333 RepID=A0A372NPT7_9SPHI|nr:YbbR-like domain-containing protein [Mucilaginibacter conchicola]RFZ90647.1 YbbR-like domain-containing protein [Mucilaginibacter conchicola]